MAIVNQIIADIIASIIFTALLVWIGFALAINKDGFVSSYTALAFGYYF